MIKNGAEGAENFLEGAPWVPHGFLAEKVVPHGFGAPWVWMGPHGFGPQEVGAPGVPGCVHLPGRSAHRSQKRVLDAKTNDFA